MAQPMRAGCRRRRATRTQSAMRSGPFEISGIGVALENLDGRDGAMRMGATDEDVGHRNFGVAVNLMLDLAQPFFFGGDEVEHHQDEFGFAVVQHEGASGQIVVQVFGAAILHGAAYGNTQVGRNNRSGGAGQQFFFSHDAFPSTRAGEALKSYVTTHQ